VQLGRWKWQVAVAGDSRRPIINDCSQSRHFRQNSNDFRCDMIPPNYGSLYWSSTGDGGYFPYLDDGGGNSKMW